MDEKMVPKWQRELRSFLGIKSGIILEGNVYDDSPIFSYDGGIAEYEDTDDLEQAIISLVDTRTASAVFFDPLDGFYSYDENDLELIENICKGYRLKRGTRNHGVRTCFMPSAKDGEGNGREGSAHIWASQIIRRCMTDSFGLSPDRGVVFVLNFASRLEVFDQEDTMFLNLMQATTTSQTNSMFTNSLVMVVDKYNDIPAWYYVNNPNIHTISIGFPDRATRRLYLSNVRQHLTPFSILSSEHYDVGKRFVAETEGMRLFEMRQILQLAYKKDLKPDDIDLAFRMYKYGVIDNPWENLENDILAHIHTRLEDRVKGQEEALRKVKSVVTRAVKGLSGLQHSASSHKPKGILLWQAPQVWARQRQPKLWQNPYSGMRMPAFALICQNIDWSRATRSCSAHLLAMSAMRVVGSLPMQSRTARSVCCSLMRSRRHLLPFWTNFSRSLRMAV